MAKLEKITVGGWEKKLSRLFGLEKQIEELSSEFTVIKEEVKEKVSRDIQGFGSVNLSTDGLDVEGQVQKRRPTISITNGNIATAQKLLGDRFNMFFDSVTDGTEVLREERKKDLKALIVKAGLDPSEFFTLHQEAKANDTFLKEDVREALLGKKATKIFEELMKVVNVRGAIEGVIAFKWTPKKG